MKTLYLMRHAQKEINENKDDYDIELTQEGKKSLTFLCERLKQKNIHIDMILASPAIRAEQTAEIIAKNLDFKGSIIRNDSIYKAFLNELIETISYTYDNVNSLFLVGHNPALATLAFKFTKIKQKVDMGSVVRIDFDCDSWLDINENNAKFVYIEHSGK